MLKEDVIFFRVIGRILILVYVFKNNNPCGSIKYSDSDPDDAFRIADASSTAHLDKVDRGYESMDHFKVEFKKEGKALRSIDFIQGKGTALKILPAILFSRFRLVVVWIFYLHLQMMKMRTKRMKRQRKAARKMRGPRLCRKAVLFRLLLSSPPTPSSRTPPKVHQRAPLRASCQLLAQTTPTPVAREVLLLDADFRSVAILFPPRLGGSETDLDLCQREYLSC